MKMELLRLVIIEDEDAHFQLMKRAISKDLPHALVYHFADAGAYVEKLNEIHPDVILVDYLMPGMNGIEFLEVLNQRDVHVPVVMITGQGDESIAVQAMKAGAWDYLVKSPDFFKLLPSTIEKVVRERKLKDSLSAVERRFQDLAENTSDWIWEIDTEGRYLYSNPAVEQILGYRPDEIIGCGLYELFPERKEEIHGPACLPWGTQGRPFSGFVFNLVHRSGREVIVETNGVPVFDSKGSVIAYRGINRDITQRVRTEEMLREREQINRLLLDSLPQPAMLIKRDRTIVAANRMAESMGARVGGLCWREFAQCRYIPREHRRYIEEHNGSFPPGGTKCSFCCADEVFELGKSANAPEVSAFGRLWDTWWIPIDEEVYFHYAIDITGIKQRQRELRKERDFVRSLIETAQAIVLVLDPEGRIVQFNPYMEQISGYQPREVKGKDWLTTFLPKRDHHRMRQVFRAAVSNVVKHGHIYPIVTKDGQERVIDWYSKPLKDPEGRTTGLLSIGLDITERKKAQDALLESEERYRRIVETAREGIWMVDAGMRTTFVNRQMANMLGYTVQEMLGRSLFDSMDEAARVEAEALIQRGWQNTCEQFDFRFRRRDGSVLWAIIGTTSLFNGSGDFMGVLGMVTDITQRKLAEEGLKESEERLRFVSSKLLTTQEEERKRIARELHDSIGSSLSAIKISLENARSRFEQGIVTADSFEVPISWTQHTIEEARRIMMDLRPSLLDDLGIIATINWFCRQYRMIYPSIYIEREIGIEEYEIDESLKIVIFRIMQEAFHNIAKYSKAELVEFSLLKKEDRIEMTIEDNGVGFDLESASAVQNEKRGLGLAGMKERTELSGGAFDINSILDSGTILRASWPYHSCS
jgi:PAS domain S-box-containing protein